MGDNSDQKKKIWVTYFFMRYPYMKFKNISLHGSKVIYAQESDNMKWPEIAKGHNSNNISFHHWKFNQVISSVQIKALAQIFFLDILLTRFQCYFIKREITKMGDNMEK